MYYNPHPQDEYQPATSTRERESILKKQAAGLAAAAAGRVQEKRESAGAHDLSNHTTDPTRKVQLGGEPLHVDGNSTRGDGNPMPQDDLGNTRTQRIQALEQRKRELEALAREASLRRAAMQEQESRKKHSRPAYRNRTVNIDVYTGEVIGDLPKIEEERKAQGRSKNEDDSSSVHSTTEYDLPITKASRSRRIVLFGLLIIALTLGLYFGITRSKDNVNSDTSALETLPPVSSPASNLPTIIDVPTLKPTAHPTSLRSPTEPETSFPIYVPTTPNPTTDPFNNTDPGLLDLVLAEWPLLMEAVLDESSPQVQALEWLSSDEGLDTYSNSQKMQRFALATFYYSTGGAMWLNDDGWLSTDDECTWFTTSGTNPCNQDGSYISLELINNNLNGTIPAELALLSNNLITVTLIRELDQLSLYGTIPTEMGLLTQLQFFNVRGHELEGPIPSEFGNVTGLRRLIVRQNMLSGEIPSELGVLTRLRFLELEDNRLVGSIPSEIGQLTLLESILVARNQLTGDIPSQIGQWTAMGTFSASMNGFTSIPTEIGNLSSLLSMDLVGNKLRGTIPSEVGKLSKLSRLELGNNSLSGTIPTTIGNLILLAEDLDLSENQLSGPIPTEFGRLVVLRQLLLNSNQLTGQIPTEFRALSRLGTSISLPFFLIVYGLGLSQLIVIHLSIIRHTSSRVHHAEWKCSRQCLLRVRHLHALVRNRLLLRRRL
jgi:Leucine-rich repeat (LRR) protein